MSKEMSKTVSKVVNRKYSYIAGFYAVHADGAFLNGAGLESGKDKTTVLVKSYYRNKTVPYVSSQAWRRWLRNTLIKQTGWPQSTLEAIDWNKAGNTSKIAGQLDPITYPEDDLFGYMFAKAASSKQKESSDKKPRANLPDVQLIRISPFKSSILRGVPELTFMARDEGFVHLKDDTPVPYTTEFYSGELVALFGLEIYRLGVFEKVGSISEELDPNLIVKYKESLEEQSHPIFGNRGKLIMIKDLQQQQNKRTIALLKAISTLDGGAKLTQFGVDVSPRFIILAGLKSGNLIFDDLLISQEGKPALNVSALSQIIDDYREQLATEIYIGARNSYLANETEVLEFIKENDLIYKQKDHPELLSVIKTVNAFIETL